MPTHFLTWDDKVVLGTVDYAKMSGEPGLGTSWLLVELRVSMRENKWQSQQRPHVPRILSFGGTLELGSRTVVGFQTELVFMACLDRPQEHPLRLRASLSPSQVRALEQARGPKGNLDFSIRLQTEATWAPATKRLDPLHLPAHVNASHWSELLSEMKFEDRTTFEIPVEGGRVGPPLDGAAKHMRSALDQLHHRQWSKAVGDCREVLDAVYGALALAPSAPDWKDWNDKAIREAWTTKPRMAALHMALRHVSHVGHHAKLGEVTEQEARAVVAMTGAMLVHYATPS